MSNKFIKSDHIAALLKLVKGQVRYTVIVSLYST